MTVHTSKNKTKKKYLHQSGIPSYRLWKVVYNLTEKRSRSIQIYYMVLPVYTVINSATAARHNLKYHKRIKALDMNSSSQRWLWPCYKIQYFYWTVVLWDLLLATTLPDNIWSTLMSFAHTDFGTLKSQLSNCVTPSMAAKFLLRPNKKAVCDSVQ